MAMDRSFEIDIWGMNGQVARLEAVERKLENVIQGVGDVIVELGNISSEYAAVREFLLKKKQEIIQQKKDVASLKAGLILIISIYVRTEASLISCGIPDGGRESAKISKRAVDGRDSAAEDLDLYDDKGSYGGNQGALSNLLISHDEYQQCVERVQKYHPEWDVETIEKYFKTMNSEGCVYTAASTPFWQRTRGGTRRLKGPLDSRASTRIQGI